MQFKFLNLAGMQLLQVTSFLLGVAFMLRGWLSVETRCPGKPAFLPHHLALIQPCSKDFLFFNFPVADYRRSSSPPCLPGPSSFLPQPLHTPEMSQNILVVLSCGVYNFFFFFFFVQPARKSEYVSYKAA